MFKKNLGKIVQRNDLTEAQMAQMITDIFSGNVTEAQIGALMAALATKGETFEELKSNILDAVNLSFEDQKLAYTLEEIKFGYDLASFFEFYKVINAKALSKRIGMNQSLLAQYIKGIKNHL